MILQQAIKIAEDNNKEFCVIGGAEYPKAFTFAMYPKDNPSNWGNGAVYCVEKSDGSSKWVNGGFIPSLYGMNFKVLTYEDIKNNR